MNPRFISTSKINLFLFGPFIRSRPLDGSGQPAGFPKTKDANLFRPFLPSPEEEPKGLQVLY